MNDCSLGKRQQRQGVQVDAVNALRYMQIAENAKENQRINPCIKPIVRNEVGGKSSEGCRCQRARSNQTQTPMELRLLAPIKGSPNETVKATLTNVNGGLSFRNSWKGSDETQRPDPVNRTRPRKLRSRCLA
jgi:hypothetical protein